MNKNEEIIKEIKKSFKLIHDSDFSGRKNWTMAFLNKLRELGEKNGYTVYPNSEEGEWLFDHCWSEENKGGNWIENFKGLKLICESEWNTDHEDIIYDFQKLAVGKAEIKIMIVQCNGNDEYEILLRKIENAVDSSLIEKDSQYILVASDNKGELKFTPLWNNNHK